MKYRIKSICRMMSIALPGVVVIGCLTQLQLPDDAGSPCATSLTEAEFNGWFESGAVSLNGVVKPANSVLFPDIPNCSFYKWSEQMFLWLTSPAPPKYGTGGGLIMNSPVFYDVSLPDASDQRVFVPHTSGKIRAFNLRTAQKGVLDLPIVLERRTLRVLEVMPPVLSPAGNPIVLDQVGNEVEVGGSRANSSGAPTLLDTNGKEISSPRATIRSKSAADAHPFEKKLARLEKFEKFDRTALVQKLTIDRKVFFLDLFGHFTETEQGQADGGVLMSRGGSLVYYAIMVNNVFALYRTMQGPDVPDGTLFPRTQAELDAITSFAAANGMAPVVDPEALAIEIKSSWVEADSLFGADDFIQMEAIVPTYDKSDPNDWVPNGTKTTKLAMVGMHVVGSTKGHPELLWGTFEHVSCAPSAEYIYEKTPSVNKTVPQDTSGNWVFCSNGSTGPFNEMRMKMGGADFMHVVPTASQTIGPSDILRTRPWGLPGNSPNKNSQVISINDTVRSLLAPADIRRNYFHVGTTWTIGGASPNSSNQVGTNQLANTTMETFMQGTNCFLCHHTNTTIVSHVFNDTKPLF